MSLEYYGAPKEAGAYIPTATSSSQEEDLSYSGSSIRNYFSTYKSDVAYPDFMLNYGESGDVALEAPRKPAMGMLNPASL